MFENVIVHTEHRDVIHDCSYDYYGQVTTMNFPIPNKRRRFILRCFDFVIFLVKSMPKFVFTFPENGNMQFRSNNKSVGTER